MQAYNADAERTTLKVETRAHRSAMTTPIAEVASRLQDLFGQKLVAIMVNSGDPKAVGRWAKGEREPQSDNEAQLRRIYQVVELLLSKESSTAIRSWMVGMNPLLDDKAPALVIAEHPDRVMQVAKAFLAEE
jgi:hypothetical protein